MTDNKVAIDALTANLVNLNSSNAKFANNLIDFYNRKKRLSLNQLFWVEKLAKQVDSDAGNVNMNSKNDNEIEVGSFAKIERMFEYAKKKLKYPGVIVMVESVGKVMVTVPYEGDTGIDIMIKVGNDKNTYVGTVEEGIFYPHKSWYKLPDRVVELLKKLSEDPINTMLEYGRATSIAIS